jgi:hypothetical protein
MMFLYVIIYGPVNNKKYRQVKFYFRLDIMEFHYVKI